MCTAEHSGICKTSSPQRQPTKPPGQPQLLIQLQPHPAQGDCPTHRGASLLAKPPCVHTRACDQTAYHPINTLGALRPARLAPSSLEAFTLATHGPSQCNRTTQPPQDYSANHNFRRAGWWCSHPLLRLHCLNCRLAACCCLVDALLGLVCGPVNGALNVVSTTCSAVGSVLGNILGGTCVCSCSSDNDSTAAEI
jgi:hypothetical protein